ncbi:MAG: histidinol phosphate phosphatase domain-containing protein [Bacillota bacterium]
MGFSTEVASDGVIDFHTHSVLSDGEFIPAELIRRAVSAGYRVLAVTDHVGIGDLDAVIDRLRKDCELAMRYWNITVIAGVELTHIPAGFIPQAAERAKARGAEIVLVHGETIGEPVEPGTNLAAVSCRHVDVLAHPGFLTVEEARLAKGNGVFLELSAAAKTHSLTNGHVARVARLAGAALLVNSDAHSAGQLLSAETQVRVARGAGLDESEVRSVLVDNPAQLLARMGRLTIRSQSASS